MKSTFFAIAAAVAAEFDTAPEIMAAEQTKAKSRNSKKSYGHHGLIHTIPAPTES